MRSRLLNLRCWCVSVSLLQQCPRNHLWPPRRRPQRSCSAHQQGNVHSICISASCLYCWALEHFTQGCKKNNKQNLLDQYNTERIKQAGGKLCSHNLNTGRGKCKHRIFSVTKTIQLIVRPAKCLSNAQFIQSSVKNPAFCHSGVAGTRQRSAFFSQFRASFNLFCWWMDNTKQIQIFKFEDSVWISTGPPYS